MGLCGNLAKNATDELTHETITALVNKSRGGNKHDGHKTFSRS